MKTARKGKTLAALEKAAMRFYKYEIRTFGPNYLSAFPERRNLYRACARHAASKKRKGTK